MKTIYLLGIFSFAAVGGVPSAFAQTEISATKISANKNSFIEKTKSIAKYGIYLRLIAVDQGAANITGGQKQGAANAFALAFGSDIDLQQLVGLPGGSVHVTFNKSVGESLASGYVGNDVSFQSKYKSYHNLRLAELDYQQKLFNNKITIDGGRVSALSFFNVSEIYCNFQSNAFCFNPAVVPIADKGLSFYPYDTWGGRVKISPAPWVYIQGGAFQSDPSLIPSDGFDWSSDKANGIESIGEIGFQSPSDLTPYAFHLRLGGYNNGAPALDPYLNASGHPEIKQKGPMLIHQGGQSGFYIMGDIDVDRLNRSGSRNIKLFGGTVIANKNYLTFTNQTLFGVLVTGPFASRPLDTLGLAATYLHLGSREVDYLQAARSAVGGTGTIPDNEEIFELNYGFHVAQGIKISPNIQYVLNPDTISDPKVWHQSKGVFAFGLQFTVNPAAMMGMPVWH